MIRCLGINIALVLFANIYFIPGIIYECIDVSSVVGKIKIHFFLFLSPN